MILVEACTSLRCCRNTHTKTDRHGPAQAIKKPGASRAFRESLRRANRLLGHFLGDDRTVDQLDKMTHPASRASSKSWFVSMYVMLYVSTQSL